MTENKLKLAYDSGAIPNDLARQQRTIDHAILKSWLLQKRTHFINQHRFCLDVKKSMDELLVEFESLVDEKKKGE